jgi:hypothetical protein
MNEWVDEELLRGGGDEEWSAWEAVADTEIGPLGGGKWKRRAGSGALEDGDAGGLVGGRFLGGIFLGVDIAVDPDALDDAEEEHEDDGEGAAVTDERQGETGDGDEVEVHADVHEGMGENEGDNPDDEESSELVAGIERHEEGLEDEESEA